MDATMGTPRQADALIKMNRLIVKQNGARAFTPEQEEKLRAEVIAASHAKIQTVFKSWNAQLGFDRFSSPATPDQLRRIRELEVQLTGEPRTRQYVAKLSYDAADHLLKDLITERQSRRLGVTALEAIANEPRPNMGHERVNER
jgi:hypothetical protein